MPVLWVKPAGKVRHRKILCISDIHIPFHNKRMLSQAIEDNLDADLVVVNGDLIDCFSVSRYDRFTKAVTLLQEYAITLEFVKELSEKFPMVVLTMGNHEHRVSRFISSTFDVNQKIIANSSRFAPGGHILASLAEGNLFDVEGAFIGSYNFTNVTYTADRTPWFVKIGKTLFVHPYKGVGGKYPLKTVINNYRELLPFIDDVDCVVLGHTHTAGETYENGVKLIEQGCLCLPQEYAIDAFRQPFMNGYAVIHQDRNGNTIFEDSRVVYLGYQILDKQPLSI